MPPRYAYWTILVDEQPTAFRAGDANDLQPTFKRLQQKHPSARMVWFQNGKVWNSRLEAQEAMRVRGERGRQGDFRQRRKLEWKPKGTGPAEGRSRRSAEREGGKPKGTPAPAENARTDRPRLEWRPKGTGPAEGRSRWSAQRQGGKPKSGPAAAPKLEWKPKGTFQPEAEGRKSKPQKFAEGRDSRRGAKREGGREGGPKRDRAWRPGGEHRDPRQKYKDAKKAKWTRFKKQIRTRWETKQTRKKKDDE